MRTNYGAGRRTLQCITIVSLLLCIPPGLVAAEDTAQPCIACKADTEALRRTYSDEDWARLTRGDVLTSDVEEAAVNGSRPHAAQASGIIEYPPERVWTVVTDLESRPDYVPGNKEVRIVRVEGNRIWSTQHLRVLFTNVRYGLISTLEPERGRLLFGLDYDVAHDIADTHGSWELAPLRDRDATLVRYRAWVDTGRPIPGFLQSFMTRRSLPQLVEGVREEVRRRFPR